LEALASSRTDLRLRRIDVKKWSSPVALQHVIKSLPALVLYKGDKLIAGDYRQVLGKLNSL